MFDVVVTFLPGEGEEGGVEEEEEQGGREDSSEPVLASSSVLLICRLTLLNRMDMCRGHVISALREKAAEFLIKVSSLRRNADC